MFRYFAENITYILIKHKFLNIKNREIYVYSIEVILLNFILLLTLLSISIAKNSLLFFVGFLLFFLPIRIFAGGYHARHSETCFGLTVGVYITAMIIYDHFPDLYKNGIAIGLFIVAYITLLIWAPLKNPNHPLTDYQYKRNRRIVFGITFISMLLFAISYKLECKIASSEVIFIIMASIFLLIGKAENNKGHLII